MCRRLESSRPIVRYARTNFNKSRVFDGSVEMPPGQPGMRPHQRLGTHSLADLDRVGNAPMLIQRHQKRMPGARYELSSACPRPWAIIAVLNPLTYEVDGIRGARSASDTPAPRRIQPDWLPSRPSWPPPERIQL